MFDSQRSAALDEIDIAILKLLRENARRTLTDIATLVNLSPAPVKRRIDRLERSGIVRGYTVLLDPGALRVQITAYCRLRLVTDLPEEVVSWLLDTFSEVDEVSALTGNDEFMVKMYVETIERLHQLVDEFRRHPRIVSTGTHVVLRSWARQPLSPTDDDVE